MNRKLAKQKVFDGISAAELKGILNNITGDLSKPSKLNKGMTRNQALGIYSAWLKNIPDEFIYQVNFDDYKKRYNYSQCLGAMNILREFA